jgi:acetoin utilization deacetylase AcuC-like enzyme
MKGVIMARIAIVRDPIYLKHSNGPGHPESPTRLEAVNEMLAESLSEYDIKDIPARDATFDEIAYIHDAGYIKRIEETRNRPYTQLDPDTGATSDSYAAAIRAAGGAIEAVDAVMEGTFDSAFAFLRPPGHHAESGRAAGFCLFNNIGIGAAHAINRRGLERILIVDWDLHHGNGTMHSFYDSNQVLYFSTHQYPYYPGTGQIRESGRGAGEGYTVNVPLSPGQGDAEYLAVFRKVLQPIALEYAPELILVSAGFDNHYQDPLGGMNVSKDGFADMASVLLEIADECCQGKIVLMLEGGYSLAALQESVAEVLLVLLRERRDPLPPLPPENSQIYKVINEVISTQKPYWKSL